MAADRRAALPPSLHALRSLRPDYASGFAVAGLTIVLAQLVTPMWGRAVVAYDTTAMVLYFERIIHGQVLETFVPTTPTPLLVAILGLVWELTHDWRAISAVSVVVFAAANGLATILGWRIAGALAGLVAGIVMASSPLLMFEAVRGLATPWATAGWMIAALAVTAARPRWVLAGVSLAVAMLARVETLAIVAAAGVGLVVLSAGPSWIRRDVPRRAWAILLGFAALPIMLGHDWLLARNPLLWAQVSGIVSAERHKSTGLAGIHRILALAGHTFVSNSVIPAAIAIGLAVVGMIVLARRSPLVAYGGAALAIGVAAFMLSAGYAGYVVPVRYA